MEGVKKISFRQKNPTQCPVCSFEFHREEMLSGGGRLIAGKLTDELRRLYEVSKKYGKVYPSAYVVTVCPNCLYAAFTKDFSTLKQEEIEKLRELTSARKNAIKKFFGNLDFNEDRNLQLGAASYMLVVDCYSFRNKNVAPTFKNAMSSMRAAWLFGDLAREHPEKPFKKISVFFYKKAFQYYVRVLDLIQNGKEPMEAAGHLGPDTDKNWGYEGVLYLTAYLTVKIGSKEPDIHKRLELFEKCKRYLSRLFGVGKTSKSRPSELLDMTKDLYEKINELMDEWNAELENE
jgi:uncharacterized protein (DUF2225 family)